MTKEEVFALAREAGLKLFNEGWTSSDNGDAVTEESLERFAELVAAHEREECAYVCLVYARRAHENDMPTAYVNGANDCFNAIKGKR